LFEWVIPIFGLVLSLCMYLSPIPAVMKAKRRKAVGDFNPVPSAMTCLQGVALTIYGLVIENINVLIAGASGAVIGLYIIAEIFPMMDYSSEFARIQKTQMILVGAGTLQTCVAILALYLSPATMLPIYQVHYTLLVICMYAGPLTTMKTVIRTRNSVSIDPALAACQFATALCWFCYGFVLLDPPLIFVNALGVVCSTTQLALRVIYRPNGNVGPAALEKLNLEERKTLAGDANLASPEFGLPRGPIAPHHLLVNQNEIIPTAQVGRGRSSLTSEGKSSATSGSGRDPVPEFKIFVNNDRQEGMPGAQNLRPKLSLDLPSDRELNMKTPPNIGSPPGPTFLNVLNTDGKIQSGGTPSSQTDVVSQLKTINQSLKSQAQEYKDKQLEGLRRRGGSNRDRYNKVKDIDLSDSTSRHDNDSLYPKQTRREEKSPIKLKKRSKKFRTMPAQRPDSGASKTTPRASGSTLHMTRNPKFRKAHSMQGGSETFKKSHPIEISPVKEMVGSSPRNHPDAQNINILGPPPMSTRTRSSKFRSAPSGPAQ